MIKLKKDVSAIFVEKAYTGPTCHDLITFGTNVLGLDLVHNQSNINTDEENFSCIDTLAKHAKTSGDPYKALAKKFKERANKDCVIAFMSPLNKPTGDFEKHAYYEEKATEGFILSHSYAVLGGKVDTGIHVDTVTDPNNPQPATVGKAYTADTRAYSDACGVVIPNTDDSEASKTFFLRPPSERQKVGERMLKVIERRKAKEEEIKRAVEREKKKREMKVQETSSVPSKKERSIQAYTKENKIFFTALEHEQPLPLFRGKYSGPNFTEAEMRYIGFKCPHEVKGGTMYIIPREAWHSVFNTTASCFSYAWDCMYQMFASEKKPEKD
jgi:hypothetical protein